MKKVFPFVLIISIVIITSISIILMVIVNKTIDSIELTEDSYRQIDIVLDQSTIAPKAQLHIKSSVVYIPCNDIIKALGIMMIPNGDVNTFSFEYKNNFYIVEFSDYHVCMKKSAQTDFSDSKDVQLNLMSYDGEYVIINNAIYLPEITAAHFLDELEYRIQIDLERKQVHIIKLEQAKLIFEQQECTTDNILFTNEKEMYVRLGWILEAVGTTEMIYSSEDEAYKVSYAGQDYLFRFEEGTNKDYLVTPKWLSMWKIDQTNNQEKYIPVRLDSFSNTGFYCELNGSDVYVYKKTAERIFKEFGHEIKTRKGTVFLDKQ